MCWVSSSSVAWLLAKSFRSISRWTTCGFLYHCLLPSATMAEWAAQSFLQSKPVLLERRREPAGTADFAVVRCGTVLAWTMARSLKDKTWFKRYLWRYWPKQRRNAFSWCDGIKHPFLQRTGVIHLGEYSGAAQAVQGWELDQRPWRLGSLMGLVEVQSARKHPLGQADVAADVKANNKVICSCFEK